MGAKEYLSETRGSATVAVLRTADPERDCKGALGSRFRSDPARTSPAKVSNRGGFMGAHWLSLLTPKYCAVAASLSKSVEPMTGCRGSCTRQHFCRRATPPPMNKLNPMPGT